MRRASIRLQATGGISILINMKCQPKWHQYGIKISVTGDAMLDIRENIIASVGHEIDISMSRYYASHRLVIIIDIIIMKRIAFSSSRVSTSCHR